MAFNGVYRQIRARWETDGVVDIEAGSMTARHDLSSDYFEHYYTPVMGPTCVLLARRLLDHAGTSVDVADLALAVGLGRSTQSLWRAVIRLNRFQVASVYGPYLVIRPRVPSIDDPRQTRLLPSWLATAPRQGEAA